MEGPENGKKKVSFSDWLELLQQESWQLELLVSGFALFGIWESRHMLNRFDAYVGSHMLEDPSIIFVMAGLSLLLNAAWGIFFINLLIHVVLRGLWIGAIGLRYVSGEIDYKTLGYNEKFEDYLARRVGRFDNYIEKLEKVCSVIFAYTFLLFFIFLSSVMVLFHIVILATLTSYLSEIGLDSIGITLLCVYLSLGFVVLIDFLTIGSIKKVRSDAFATVYGYIYRFYSYITLSFLYRPLLFNFFDYKYTRRLFWFSVPYVIIVFFLFPNFYLENTQFYPSTESAGDHYWSSEEIIKDRFYDDLRYQHYHRAEDIERIAIRDFSLGSSEISHSSGKIFFPFDKEDFGLFKYKYHITPFNEQGLQHGFFDYIIEDTILTNIKTAKSAALLDIRKAERAARKAGELPAIKITKDNNSAANGFSSGIRSGRYGDMERALTNQYEISRDSIKKYWEKYYDDYIEKKISTIKNAMMDANQVYIDDISYQDKLTCKLYTHPNLKEKGILCYFPTDSLPDGEHILRWERKNYNPHQLDSIKIKKRSVPFWMRSKR